MPTEDWLSTVVQALDPWNPPPCRTCGERITDRMQALKYAAPDRAPERTLVRWYCSEVCQRLGQEKP